MQTYHIGEFSLWLRRVLSWRNSGAIDVSEFNLVVCLQEYWLLGGLKIEQIEESLCISSFYSILIDVSAVETSIDQNILIRLPAAAANTTYLGMLARDHVRVEARVQNHLKGMLFV